MININIKKIKSTIKIKKAIKKLKKKKKKMYWFFFFSLLKLIINSGCGLDPPLNSSYCFNRDPLENRTCCFLSNSNRKMCHLFPDRNITENKTIEINNEIFNVECNFDDSLSLMGYPCGESDVTALENCTDYSLVNNPCCLYNNSFTGTLTCFYMGRITQTSLLSYDKDIINCSSKFLKRNLFIFIFWGFLFLGF